MCGTLPSALQRFVHVLLELLRSGTAVQESPRPPPSSSSCLPPLFIALCLAGGLAPAQTPESNASLPGDFLSPPRLATVPPRTLPPACSGWIFPFCHGAELERGVTSARAFRPYNRIDHSPVGEGDYSLPLRGGCCLPPAPRRVPSRPARALRGRPPLQAPGRSAGDRPPSPATSSPPWNDSNKGRRGWGMSPRRGH